MAKKEKEPAKDTITRKKKTLFDLVKEIRGDEPSDYLVLVLDDVGMMRRMIKTALEEAGFRTAEAKDASTALDMLHDPQRDFHCIILDVVLPRFSGYDFLAKIRRDADLKELPAIVVSARGDKESILRAVQLGAFSYLLKPLTPETLIRKVREALGFKESEKEDETDDK